MNDQNTFINGKAENNVKRNVVKRSRQEWQALLELWRASGLTMREFCKSRNIPKTSFYYWADMQTNTRPISNNIAFATLQTKLAPIEVAQTPESAALISCANATSTINAQCSVEVILPCGTKFIFPEQYDMNRMLLIIQELKTC